MKKSVLIGIIVATVVIVGVVGGVVLSVPNNNDGTTTTSAPCKHDDPSKIVVVEAVAPTCQETGLTEGKKCTVCDTMVVPQSTVQTIECIESDWIIDKEATPTEDGKQHKECTMCDKIFDEEVILAGYKKLKYTLLDNNTYEVSGIGSCKDTDIVIPSEYNGLPVTSIGYRAFEYCHKMTSIEIPNTITNIGEYAFNWCSRLTSVVIPNSITIIDDVVFKNCTSLKSVIIPDSVTSIGYRAFDNCPSLTSITFEGTVEQWNAIKKGQAWGGDGIYVNSPLIPATEVVCSDGTVKLK